MSLCHRMHETFLGSLNAESSYSVQNTKYKIQGWALNHNVKHSHRQRAGKTLMTTQQQTEMNNIHKEIKENGDSSEQQGKATKTQRLDMRLHTTREGQLLTCGIPAHLLVYMQISAEKSNPL